jgi:hypothetical protein
LGGSLLLANRLLFTPDLLTSQSRSDALGILLSAGLILTGLLWQQSQPMIPATVALQGKHRFDLDPALTEAQQLEVSWASATLLKHTAVRSVVIWADQRLLLQRGLLPAESPPTPIPAGSILQRVLTTGRSVYLVDLKLFPAKAELTLYLPSNTQAALCQPIGQRGVLILGTDTPRAITALDQRWIESIAQKLDQVLFSAILDHKGVSDPKPDP